MGPNHETPPVCLSCFKLVRSVIVRLYRHPALCQLSEDWLPCPECSLPMCSAQCAEGAHRQLECAVLARRRNKVAISNMDTCTPHPFYQCIAPLRWDNLSKILKMHI